MVLEDPGQPSVELVIKVTPEAAVAGSRHDALVAAIAALGVRVEILPATAAAANDTFGSALVGKVAAERLLGSLQQLDGVESAYLKPRGEPPQRENPQ